MQELTKSVVSSSWALSLFGAQQFASLFSGGDNGSSLSTRARSLDAVTGAVTSNLSNRLHHLYDLGDGAQRGMVDLAGAALRLDAAGLLKPSLDLANPLVEGLAAATPRRDWLIDWQELRNKIDIYDLVKNVERRLNVSDGAPIAQLVDRAYGLGDFHALWAVEGLGHYYGQQSLMQTDNPHGLLSDPAAIGLPDKSLTMLNAGLGLAFAEKLLGELSPDRGDREIDKVVQRFVELCQDNATPGYTGCALESLGLVTRTFHARLLSCVDRSVVSLGNEELLGYFWHGAGRANYFAARNFLPCMGISWKELVRQSSHEIGQCNLVAGLAWAITLVNMRTPSVMEKLLRQSGPEITHVDAEAFVNGVTSSIVMRQDTTPPAEFVSAFCRCQRGASASQDQLWHELIERPCSKAVNHLHPKLSRQRALEEVFRFQSLDHLVRRVNEHFSMAVQ